MAKDSFIFHLENAEDLEDLTLEEQGMILQAMIEYSRTGKQPHFEDRALRSVWRPIFRRLKADKEAYEEKCESNRENGKKGGRPPKEENRTVISENPKKPKKADSDSESESDKDIYINTMSGKPDRAGARIEIIKYLNEKTGKEFRHSSQATVRLIEARLNEGYTIDDFRKVIDNKAAEWKGTEQEQYLRPETLFAPSHFESYLNQKAVRPKPRSTLPSDMTRTYDMDELRRRAKV